MRIIGIKEEKMLSNSQAQNKFCANFKTSRKLLCPRRLLRSITQHFSPAITQLQITVDGQYEMKKAYYIADTYKKKELTAHRQNPRPQ